MRILSTQIKGVLTNSSLRNPLQKRVFSATSSLNNVQSEEVEYRELMKAHTNGVMSYASTTSEFPLVNQTIRELLAGKAKSHANKVGYAFPYQGVNMTWAELKERVDTIAQNFLDMGFQKGDRIAFALPTNIELLVMTLAASEIGLVSTLLNPAYQKTEFEYMLKKVNAKGLVIYDSFKVLQHMKIMQHICPEIENSQPGELKSKNLPDLKHVIVLNSPLSPEKLSYNGTWKYSDVVEKKSIALKRDLPNVDLDDPSLILFTSGTTGTPKAAVVRQGNLLNSPILATVVIEKEGANACPLNGVPFFHIYGYSVGIIMPLFFDSTNVFPFFFPDTVWSMKAMQAYKCNGIRGAPTQFIDLLNHPERKNYDLSNLKNALIAGATVSPDLLSRLKTETSIEDIFVGYGMTETSLCHSITTMSCKKRGNKYAYESCGRGIPFSESKIVNLENGQVQPLGQDGELHIRGPHIFKEYYDEPEKSREAIDENGWLNTGDVFSMDKDGYLFFKSRNKDIIIRGGANIYPAEIEDYLRSNSDIMEAQAFGVPDERVGEEVAVWVKLRPDAKMTAEDLKEFCKGNISHFKIPRYIKFVDSFPINASLKVLKTEMRKSSATDFNL